MEKIYIDLFSVNRNCRVKFGIIMSNKLDKKDNPALTLYKNAYDIMMLLKPHPFLIVDISQKDDKDGRKITNSNATFTLNRYDTFKFTRVLKKMAKGFEERDLFYYTEDTDELKVNQSLSSRLEQNIILNNGKHLYLRHLVVQSDEEERQYEGIALYVNHIDTFNIMTYEEVLYFIYELNKLDIINLSIRAIALYYTVNKDEEVINKQNLEVKVETEVKEDDTKIDSPIPCFKKVENKIPDI